MERSNALYYASKDPLGATGDFTTSPEISQIFGELVGLWLLHNCQSITASQIALVEFGPGRGTLMQDILRVFSLVPEICAKLQIFMVENSPSLTAIQKQTLKNITQPITWQTAQSALPQMPTLIVANEFFDALPIEQYIFDGQNWREQCITISEDGILKFTQGQIATPTIKPPHPPKANDIFETSQLSISILKSWAQHLKTHSGFVLTIDYGHAHSGFGDTFQAVKDHQIVPTLSFPGNADLTAHVDFEQLLNAAQSENITTLPILTQAEFLNALGLEQRVKKLTQNKTAEIAQSIIESAQRLIDINPKGMGELFKVLMLSCPQTSSNAG